MARPALALALGLAATLLAAGPAMAGPGPGRPELLPLPETVTSLPLSVEWTPSAFTPGSVDRHYEVRIDDRTRGDDEEDSGQTVIWPAPVELGTVTASVMLADGHSYALRVRGVETICRPNRPTDCDVRQGKYGDEQRTRGQLAPADPPRAADPPPQLPTAPRPVDAGAAPPTPRPLDVGGGRSSPEVGLPTAAALPSQVRLEAAPPAFSKPKPHPRPRWVAPL